MKNEEICIELEVHSNLNGVKLITGAFIWYTVLGEWFGVKTYASGM